MPHGEYGSAGDVFVVVLFFVAGDYGSAELTASNSTNQVTINSGQTESQTLSQLSVTYATISAYIGLNLGTENTKT